MKRRHIGHMIYFGLSTFTLVRRMFGARWFLVHKKWNVYRHVFATHFRGINAKGEKFVYCPVSLLTSWHPGDYDNRWCHACQMNFEELIIMGKDRTK